MTDSISKLAQLAPASSTRFERGVSTTSKPAISDSKALRHSLDCTTLHPPIGSDAEISRSYRRMPLADDLAVFGTDRNGQFRSSAVHRPYAVISSQGERQVAGPFHFRWHALLALKMQELLNAS